MAGSSRPYFLRGFSHSVLLEVECQWDCQFTLGMCGHTHVLNDLSKTTQRRTTTSTTTTTTGPLLWEVTTPRLTCGP